MVKLYYLSINVRCANWYDMLSAHPQHSIGTDKKPLQQRCDVMTQSKKNKTNLPGELHINFDKTWSFV